MSIHVRLPDGSSTADCEAAVAALEDDGQWSDNSSEMYVSVRDDAGHCQLTVVRRDIGVCLICKEAKDDPPGWISLGKEDSPGKSVVELEDVTVTYPNRFFVEQGQAAEAVKHFCSRRQRSPSVRWTRLHQDMLEYVPYE